MSVNYLFYNLDKDSNVIILDKDNNIYINVDQKDISYYFKIFIDIINNRSQYISIDIINIRYFFYYIMMILIYISEKDSKNDISEKDSKNDIDFFYELYKNLLAVNILKNIDKENFTSKDLIKNLLLPLYFKKKIKRGETLTKTINLIKNIYYNLNNNFFTK
jgi:hypothetical protein